MIGFILTFSLELCHIGPVTQGQVVSLADWICPFFNCNGMEKGNPQILVFPLIRFLLQAQLPYIVPIRLFQWMINQNPRFSLGVDGSLTPSI